MQTYKDFSPTQFDHHISLSGYESWLVLPCYRNRDSDCLEESNFKVARFLLEEADTQCETWAVLDFGHWACGHFSILIVQPDTLAYETALKIESALDNYPVLDDDDFSEREMEAANQTWANCYNDQERVEYIRRNHWQFQFHDFTEMLSCVRGKFFSGYASELLS